jgi:hypothetical protein
VNKLMIGIAAAAIALPTLASAQGNNGGGNGGCGVGQTTNGCGGTTNNGGTGGAGGHGGNAAAIAAQSQGQAQGQVQGQAQGQGQRQTSRNTNANTNSNSNGQSLVNTNSPSSNSGGNTVNVGGDNWNIPAIAATATAPGFALGNCGWAVSGGFQAFIAGASGGGAGVYEVCLKMQASEHFRKTGQLTQAKMVECQSADLRKAHFDAGEPCPADMPKVKSVPTAPTANAQPTLVANAWCAAPLQLRTLPNGSKSCY